jgi:hypothetical protein
MKNKTKFLVIDGESLEELFDTLDSAVEHINSDLSASNCTIWEVTCKFEPKGGVQFKPVGLSL